MEGWWFDDRLGLKISSLQCFYDLPILCLKDFININGYAN